MTTPRPLQLENLLPMAARATFGVTGGFMGAMTTVLSALVLVTSLLPVFAVCMVALRARGAGPEATQPLVELRPRIRLIPACGIATQSGRLSSS